MASGNLLYAEIAVAIAKYQKLKYANIPSQRVAEKNGMRFITEYEDAKNKIAKVYSISSEEYQNNEHNTL